MTKLTADYNEVKKKKVMNWKTELKKLPTNFKGMENMSYHMKNEKVPHI